MRGRWADGIEPRNLIWVLRDRLAVCERPGGFGANHRTVRRSEEIIWIRRNGFAYVVSLLAGPHNLHSYAEQQMPYIHLPLGDAPQAATLAAAFGEITDKVNAGDRLVMHHERIDDVLGGFLAAYLLWLGRHTEVSSALHTVERLLRRPIGRWGCETVTAFASAGIKRCEPAAGTDPGGAGSQVKSITEPDEDDDSLPPPSAAWRIVER